MRSFLLVFGFLSCFILRSQTLDEIYTTWCKENIPVAHSEITKMVKKIWDDDTKASPLIELHCKSLNQLLIKIQSEGVNEEHLKAALAKWTQAPDDLKGQNWWEWPDTNWMRVQSEYVSLLASD